MTRMARVVIRGYPYPITQRGNRPGHNNEKSKGTEINWNPWKNDLRDVGKSVAGTLPPQSNARQAFSSQMIGDKGVGH